MLKYCSDKNERIGVQVLFYFVVLVNIIGSCKNRIFPSELEALVFKVSRVALLLKRLQLDCKTDLTTTEIFLEVFLLDFARFVDFISAWIKIFKNC